MNLREYLAAQQRLVDAELDRLAPPVTTPPRPFIAPCATACSRAASASGRFSAWKRRARWRTMWRARTAACALELIHTYSLIHDDLPALDNDDYRRGKLTCHKVFGDAMAILAGDALLTLAFQVLAELPAPAERKVALIAELATASGTVGGMIGGQVADLEGEGKPPDAALLETIHRAKTGALLRASLRMGAIYAGASEEQYDALSCYGEHIGLAFQIVDDILDVEESSEALGKTAGKDAAQGKITFPAVYGLERRTAWPKRSALAPTRCWSLRRRVPRGCTSWPN
jgi:geranylgeranyl diphosphate synthase, type II